MSDEEINNDETADSFDDLSSSFQPSSLLLSESRPTWAEVDLDNLVHNFREMKEAVDPNVAILVAVKADAYGHGAPECARALERAGASWFGVALPEEGITLRESGIRRPIMCLGGFWEGQEDVLIARGLTPAIFRPDLLELLDRAARRAGRIADYHLKVDTGMGRLGVPYRELEDFLDRAAQFEKVRLNGVMSHFPSADEPERDEFTNRQIDLLEEAVEAVRARGHNPTWIHQANSAAAHAHPRSHGNLVRIGGVSYGLWHDTTSPAVEPLDWRPVMSLHTRIMFLKNVPPGTPLGYGGTFVTERDSRIATLAIGYEDGLPVALSNRGRVILHGRFAPVVGRVSMDLTLVDVTNVAGVEVGDEVIIMGRQGACRISAEDIAELTGTISYEVTCRISDRVPRVYIGGG